VKSGPNILPIVLGVTQEGVDLSYISASVVDFEQLEYISSAGLVILLKTQKRLSESGVALKIVNVNKHMHDIFRYSGFTATLEIEIKIK
jgi:anti-sigma B factor antagonist